jgi:cephalosporin-C deacetylase
MALFDLSLPELSEYRPEVTEPADFDEFWQATLREERDVELAVTMDRVDTGLALVETYDVSFVGAAGTRVRAWLALPENRSGQLPCVVQYLGYGGGRGLPHEVLLYASAGWAHLVMDTRGQGSGSTPGDTPDHEPAGQQANHGHSPGFLTRGILDPRTYYYRRLFVDAVRAVGVARSMDQVDGSRIVATGRSQGGSITLAVAALVPDLVAVAPDVPFLCHLRRAVEITDQLPYAEITEFCSVHRDRVDDVFRTLSYVDGVAFARRATMPSLWSVGLRDEVCPPSTVFAAYNWYSGQKDVRVYPYNAHEGGAAFQDAEKLRFFRAMIEA